MISFIHKHWLQKKINKDKKQQIKINNPEIIGNLEHIDYAIFDKTGTLTEKKFSLDSIFFCNKNFVIEHNLEEEKKLNPLLIPSINNNNPMILSPSFISGEFDNINPQQTYLDFSGEKYDGFPNGNFFKKQKSTAVEILKKYSNEINGQIDSENCSQESSPKAVFFNSKIDFEKMVNARNSYVREVFKCLSLTHQIGIMIYPHAKMVEKSTRKEVYDFEDELLINFCRYNGFGFESCEYESLDIHHSETTSSICYNLKDEINDMSLQYNVIGINEFSNSRKRFSICLEDKINGQVILYCKGKFDAMKERLNLSTDQRITFNNVIKTYSEKGLRIVVFAKRILEKFEADKYFNKYTTLKRSVVSQKQELENLAIEIEFDLDLVAIVGLKEKMRPDAEKSIEIFKKMNSKIWILTGDSFTNAFNVGVSVSLFTATQENAAIHFKETDGENLRYFIREILAEMKQSTLDRYQKENGIVDDFLIDEKVKENSIDLSREKIFLKIANKETEKYFSEKIVFIDGDSLSVILKDQYLKLNFIFIIALCPRIIGYNLTAEQKYDLVKIIKEKFLGSPCVLSIGDGYNDILMMKASDISIEICETLEDGINIGDIQVKNLGVLKDLMSNYGNKCSKILIFTIKLRFFQSFLFIFCLFFSNCLFYGKIFIDYENALYFSVLQGFDILLIILFDCDDVKTKTKNNFIIISQSLQKNNKFSFLLLFSLIFNAAFTALLVYLFSFCFIFNFIDSNGNPCAAFETNSIMFLVLFIINQEKILIFYVDNNDGKLKIIGHFIYLIFMIVIFGLITFSQEVDLSPLWLVIVITVLVLIAKSIFYFVMNKILIHFNSLFLKLINDNRSKKFKILERM